MIQLVFVSFAVVMCYVGEPTVMQVIECVFVGVFPVAVFALAKYVFVIVHALMITKLQTLVNTFLKYFLKRHCQLVTMSWFIFGAPRSDFNRLLSRGTGTL